MSHDTRQDLPAISVLIACHDMGRFLLKTVASVMEQLPESGELVILDNGSTDQTREVMAQAMDRWPAAIRALSQQKTSLETALNRLLSEARHAFVLFLGGDDLLEPGALETAFHQFAEEPSLAFVSGRAAFIDDQGRPFEGNFGFPSKAKDLRLHLLIENTVPLSCTVFRKAALVEICGFREGLYPCHDYDLWLRLTEQAEGVVLNATQARYRLVSEFLPTDDINLRLRQFGALVETLRRGAFPEEQAALRKSLGRKARNLGTMYFHQGAAQETLNWYRTSYSYEPWQMLSHPSSLIRWYKAKKKG